MTFYLHICKLLICYHCAACCALQAQQAAVLLLYSLPFILSTAEIYPKVYHICFFIVTYFAPLCLMVLAYIQICHKLWFQQVCTPDLHVLFYRTLQSHLLNCTDVSLICHAHISSTDSWKHVSAAEEVEVNAVLSSHSRARRACEGQDQHSLC